MRKKITLGVIIGRFQPLHNGHVAIIQQAIDECEKVLVLLGSSNRLPDHMNPLTLEQRAASLTAVFDDKIVMRNLGNFHSDMQWGQEVIAFVNNVSDDCDPKHVRIYAGDDTSEFYDGFFPYDVVQSDRKDGVSGTAVRNSFYWSGNGWFEDHKSIPKETSDILKDVDWVKYAKEQFAMEGEEDEALEHPYHNKIDPVVHAVVVQGENILLVNRKSVRGDGQLAIPGGYMDRSESTWIGALRELREETGVDIEQYNAQQVAMCVEENLDDLGCRTLGINYLYVIHPDEDVKLDFCTDETNGGGWYPTMEVLDETLLLFFNHNLCVQRLFASIAANAGEPDAKV